MLQITVLLILQRKLTLKRKYVTNLIKNQQQICNRFKSNTMLIKFEAQDNFSKYLM
jgi:hypothetical protein